VRMVRCFRSVEVCKEPMIKHKAKPTLTCPKDNIKHSRASDKLVQKLLQKVQRVSKLKTSVYVPVRMLYATVGEGSARLTGGITESEQRIVQHHLDQTLAYCIHKQHIPTH
jgi:hypothetical protein